MSFLWEKLVRPALFRLDAETAHEFGMRALRSGLVGGLAASIGEVSENLAIERFGLKFANPLGIAAGFDKNAVAIASLASLGFGHIEVGTVTLEPQPGNERPRLFRLPKDRALINRLGFNNDGAKAAAERIARAKRRCVVGVNIGKNKNVPNEAAVENYLQSFAIVHPAADYITVNVSSPNTPGLRKLQTVESLETLIDALQKKNDELGRKPLLVKIAPDLNSADIEGIARLCVRYKVDGIIATNTTVSREGLKTADPERFGPGGLSGAPLAARSTEVISRIYRTTGADLTIIGVGGVFTGDDVFKKIAAGASLVQAYTGFVYGGPGFAAAVLHRLAQIVDERGFSSLDEAVGSAH
jgi:dihydroorotate dehydrogenase